MILAEKYIAEMKISFFSYHFKLSDIVIFNFCFIQKKKFLINRAILISNRIARNSKFYLMIKSFSFFVGTDTKTKLETRERALFEQKLN
jgi:hypothetical protein